MYDDYSYKSKIKLLKVNTTTTACEERVQFETVLNTQNRKERKFRKWKRRKTSRKIIYLEREK